MAGSRISALSRQSPKDVKITFERDGEEISVYLPTEGKNREELKQAAGDYISCLLCCSQKSGFAACMARCLYDGQCCDDGLSGCVPT